ncbi:MAG: chorismate mutase [Bacteriovoracaceae bacterium]|nr:chorismate mutase [Bacteriovoracaceae bacterium]
MKYSDKLEKLRQEIDKIDNSLLKLLKKRFLLSKKVAKCKLQEKLPLYQSTRWQSMLKDRKSWAAKKKISMEFTNKLFKFIHQESLTIQKKIAQGKKHEQK